MGNALGGGLDDAAASCREKMIRWIGMKTVVFLIVILFPVWLSARPKTDIIQLANGNVINGEILTMARAYLNVSTDSMGTIAVKWPDVSRVTSTHIFVVENSEGGRYYGTLTSETDKTLQIATPFGPITMAMSSVINIYPSSRSLWRRFDGSLDAGFTYTKSSSRSQLNLNGEIRYRSSRWETQLAVDSLLSASNGETETDRDTVGLSGMRHLGSRWHLFSLAQYQHNLELSLSYRNSILGGIARRLVQTDRSVFTVLCGAAYANENYTDTAPSSNGEAGLGASYQFYKLYSPKVDISIQFFLSPSLTTSGRVRTELESQSKIELIKDFYWSLSFYDSYDSQPPGNQDQKHDYGVTTGVAWTFG